ncbi:MAG: tetratricopeptide repeat protein, partial [Methanotrichaceae archaeon]|nr:tetratricopeptide repeat protein [Methanotrichaceae archaeon]
MKKLVMMSSHPSIALSLPIITLFALSFTIQAADLPFAFNDSDIDLANMTEEEIEGLLAASPELDGVPPVTTLPESKKIVIIEGGSGPASNATVNKTVDGMNATAWFNKGEELFDLELYEEALSAFERFLMLDHNNSSAWNSKGDALRNLERYDEALEAYDRAILLDQNYTYAWR